MAGWLERLLPEKEVPNAAHEVLADLNAGQQAVQVGIEGRYHTFASRVRLRSGAVALTCPSALAGELQEEGWLRLLLPDAEPPQDLRLQISSARHGGSGAMATDVEHFVLLCKLAGATLVPRLRKEERVCTARYRDVAIQLERVEGSYRLLDISPHGAKAKLPEESAQARFPLSRRLERGTLHLGNRVQVPVRYSIPRYVMPDAVGLELVMPTEGRAQGMLDAFIAAVRQKEQGAQAG